MPKVNALSERVPLLAVLALGVTQIIGYGTLYYSFSILAPDMAAQFAWSKEWVFGALSAALLVGGDHFLVLLRILQVENTLVDIDDVVDERRLHQTSLAACEFAALIAIFAYRREPHGKPMDIG